MAKSSRLLNSRAGCAGVLCLEALDLEALAFDTLGFETTLSTARSQAATSFGPDMIYGVPLNQGETLNLTLRAFESNLGLAVVSDCFTCEGSTVVEAGSAGDQTFIATATQTYYVVVDGPVGGDFELNWAITP